MMRCLCLLVLLAFAAGPSAGQGTPPPDIVAVDAQPVPRRQVQPEYPDEAREAGIEGRVLVRLWVGRDGTVQQAQVSHSDNPVLNEPALRATRQWTFTPAMKDGRPVDVWVIVPIRFRNNRPGGPEETWDISTRTFRTGLYQISLPVGFPQPQLLPRPDSEPSPAMYGSESGDEGFLLIESLTAIGALADTSLVGLREYARLSREGMLQKTGTLLLGEPEETVTVERFVTRMKMKLVDEQGSVYYSLVDVVVPRHGTSRMVVLMLLSPDASALERASWHEALGSFRHLALGRAPFRPANALAVLNGEWQWEGTATEGEGGPFTISVAADQRSLRLDYRSPITAPDGARRSSFTYRVLGQEGGTVRTRMDGETRRLASGKPVEWDFVLRSEQEFCWRQSDLPEGTCTRSLVRVGDDARPR